MFTNHLQVLGWSSKWWIRKPWWVVDLWVWAQYGSSSEAFTRGLCFGNYGKKVALLSYKGTNKNAIRNSYRCWFQILCCFFVCSPWSMEKWSNLTNILRRWVETWNHQFDEYVETEKAFNSKKPTERIISDPPMGWMIFLRGSRGVFRSSK